MDIIPGTQNFCETKFNVLINIIELYVVTVQLEQFTIYGQVLFDEKKTRGLHFANHRVWILHNGQSNTLIEQSPCTLSKPQI